jgi:CheY-like chemotaxis protein
METLPLDQAKELKVLLVDDDNFIRRVLRQTLSSLGIRQIVDAYHGENAKNILAKHSFDLIIADVQMPKMNGLELIKAIRCGETNAPRGIRIIVITTFSETEILGSVLGLDVNGFLSKPIKPIWVSDKISEALQEQSHIRPVEEYQAVETSLPGLRASSEASRKTVNAGIVVENRERAKTIPADMAGADFQRMFIRELVPGMRIRDDLYLKDGTLLLKAGYTLSDTTIKRLLDLHSMIIDETVSILVEKDAAADDDV